MTSQLTPEQIAELRKVAEKATPGAWRYLKTTCFMDAEISAANNTRVVNLLAGDVTEANSEFIAAFNPETAKALLDALEARNKRIAEQNMLLEGADAIQTEYAEVLECQDDNDSVLAAIVALKQRAESAEQHATEIDNALCKLLPGVQYMDPPDGGSVTPLGQVRRMVADYRARLDRLERRCDHASSIYWDASGVKRCAKCGIGISLQKGEE